MKYNWELQDWPNFRYSFKSIEGMLYAFALETGEVSGILKTLPNDVQQEALLQTMISEAIKTSEIEGEFLSGQDVMSSIKNNLGLTAVPEIVHDQKAAGIGKLMIDVRSSFKEALTKEKLWEWHWFNATAAGGGQEISSAPVRAAIAHLYFESIHPFEDGNGRTGRAIAEKALSQTLGRPVMLSLSKTIEANKNNYYKALEMAQRDNGISEWLEYLYPQR